MEERLHKVVNGKKYYLSTEEEQALKATWIIEDQKIAEKQAELERTQYQRDREANYPKLGDQLDAMWKHLEMIRSVGGKLQDDTSVMLDQILAVKAEYPKPPEEST